MNFFDADMFYEATMVSRSTTNNLDRSLQKDANKSISIQTLATAFTSSSAFVLLCLLAIVISVSGCSAKPSDSAEQPVSSSPETSQSSDSEPKPVILEPLPEPEGEGGKFSISQVMQLAHENKLYRKLYKVPLDPKVGQRITVLYEGLSEQTPPVGEPESWQQRSSALRDAALAIINDSDAKEVDKKKLRAFQKAINCNNCHNQHTTDRAHSH